MGRRNRIKKSKKVVEIVDDFVRDNTDYSLEPEKKSIFSIFEKSKDKKIEDVNKKIEETKNIVEEEKKEVVKKVEEKKQVVEKKKEKVEKKVEEVVKKVEEKKEVVEQKKEQKKEEIEKKVEEEKQEKIGTFDSLIKTIKGLDKFTPNVEKTKVVMKEALTKKVLNKIDENMKILEDGKVYVLNILKKSMKGEIIFTDLDSTEKIIVKLNKHRYTDTMNYLIYNNKRIKINRHDETLKIVKNEKNIMLTTMRGNSITLNTSKKNIDIVKVNLPDYKWI